MAPLLPRAEARRGVDPYLTGSWLFLVGCLAFTADAGPGTGEAFPGRLP